MVSEFTYDDANRITAVTYPGESASNVTYTYDSTAGGNKGLGRLTGVADSAGTVAYDYDILGRVTSEQRVIGAQTYTIAYTWNAEGNVETVTYPSGRVITYGRDVNGQASSVEQQPSGGPVSDLVLSVTRTPFGPRSSVEYANNTKETRAYDQDGRITSLNLATVAMPTDIISKAYDYIDKRNLTDIRDTLNPANDQNYRYTANGFLLTAQGPWSGLTTGDDVYANATGSNRLASVTTNSVPSRQLTSDVSGNIDSDTDVGTSTTQTYSYNHPGQLAEVKINSASKGVYIYDYLSRLVSRELPASSITLHLVHDLDGNVIAEYDSTGTLITEYVWIEDRPLAVIADAGTTTAKTYWVQTDHLERPILMTDDAASTVWQASYLPFGEAASVTGTATLDYRFPGQWFQLESGLLYNWHRHYDASTGRYLQPDPLGMPDGPSRWAYLSNSPLLRTDPTGLAEPPRDAWDRFGAKAPGHPGSYPPGTLRGDMQWPGDPKRGPNWVPNPNPGRGASKYGWEDRHGNVWCPTGLEAPISHGGAHWDVQFKPKGYTNVFPPFQGGEPILKLAIKAQPGTLDVSTHLNYHRFGNWIACVLSEVMVGTQMKNIQVIDGALNTAYNIYEISDADFDLLFPNGQDIEFSEDFWERVGPEVAGKIQKDLFNNGPLKKELVRGIHGTLFYGLWDEKARFYPSKRFSDDSSTQV